MHLKFFRILLAADDGGGSGGAGDGVAASSGDTGGTAAEASLLSAATSEPPPAGGGEPGSPGDKGAGGEPGSPDGKPADDKPTEGAPESYADFTMPEGVTANEQALGEFKTLAKELGLPQDKAQKLVDLYAKQAGDAAQAPYRLWQETQTQWVTQIKADPEIGGAKLPENLAAASRAIDAYGGAELRQALDFTGAGNNPAIVRAFVKIGRELSEGSFAHGKPPHQADNRGLGEKFYPNS